MNVNHTIRAVLASRANIKEDQIQDSATFSDLGMDSISLVLAVDEINAKLSCQIKVDDITVYDTVGKLVELVQSFGGGN